MYPVNFNNFLLIFLYFVEQLSISWCTPEAIQWIGRGYNILFADPDLVGFGKGHSAPIDPGRSLINVLKFTYDEERMDFSKKNKLPDQVTYAPTRNCAESKSYSLYYGAKSYQKKLSQSVEISAGIPALAEVAFTAGFSRENEEKSSTKNAFFESRSTCMKGMAEYRQHGGKKVRLVNPDFARAVCKLPKGDVKDHSKEYMEFFDNVGTHVIKEIAIGSGTLERKTLSVEKMAKMSSKSNTFGMTVKGGTPTIQVGASTSLDSSQINNIENETKNQKKSVFNIGTDEHPGMISLKLDDLYDYVSVTFWETSCSKDDFSGKSCCADIEQIGKNVKTALEFYPMWLKLSEPTDPELKFPAKWPIGFYALPQTNLGCPDSDGFNWQKGTRYQRVHPYTELKPESLFPPSIKKLDESEVQVSQHFCVKDNDKGSKLARDWPEGSYCIYRYGDECPKNFNSGFVWWNDVGRGLEPGSEGFLPSGEYKDNTKIFFCCRDDGVPIEAILLPASKPFFLLKKGRQCQRVFGMDVQQAYVDIDTQNFDLSTYVVDYDGHHPELEYKYASGAHIKMYYCHYTTKSS